MSGKNFSHKEHKGKNKQCRERIYPLRIRVIRGFFIRLIRLIRGRPDLVAARPRQLFAA
jgi:hypothetical protein